MKNKINLWLDDIRPAPIGWLHAKTVAEAKKAFREFDVQHCSLDHDLGACDVCMGGMSPEDWLASTKMQSMPNCSHVGTGYDLICWMEKNDIWSAFRPTVHSANPVGRQKMLMVINHQPQEKFLDWA